MKTVVDTSDLPNIAKRGRIEIIKGKWYPELVNNMADACERVLRDYGYSEITQHTVPGSLEIPLAARDLLAEDTAGEIDAVICFSIIVKGDTLHFELVSNECMHGLAAVMHEFRRPVIVEVLPVYEMKQAEERAADDEFNKGLEAAAAAIEMIAWRQSIGC